MRTSVQQHEGVHLEAQVHEVTGARMIGVEIHGALGVDPNLAEPIDICREITPPKAVFSAFYQECIVAVLRPVIAVLLVALLAPSLSNDLAGRIAADSVVPSHAILDDGAEDPPHVRVQTMAFGELKGMLAFQGIRSVVAFQ